jgi:hypothetical protein
MDGCKECEADRYIARWNERKRMNKRELRETGETGEAWAGSEATK